MVEEFEHFFNKIHPLIVFTVVFLVTLVVTVGFKTVKTVLFEMRDGSVEYTTCVETDWAEDGSYCVAEEMVDNTLENRVRDHLDGSVFTGVVLGVLGGLNAYAHRSSKLRKEDKRG